MDEVLIEFYQNYVSEGHCIDHFAVTNGITNDECLQLIKIGERLFKEYENEV